MKRRWAKVIARVNGEILRIGRWPNGKRLTPEELRELLRELRKLKSVK